MSQRSNRRRPATTPEALENQLISDAYELASKQLRNGTASAQVITHLLKLGSRRGKLEEEKIHQENLLLAAKAEVLASTQRVEDLYEAALEAMSIYGGKKVSTEDDED